jgi:hypothetical protein
MKMENIRKYFMRVVIASVIAAAGIAVLAILIGEFNDTLGKALLTLGLVTAHALISITYFDNRDKVNINNELTFFANVIFSLIVMSFFTSIFWIWGLFSVDLVAKLYAMYFIFGFATLHAELLSNTTKKEKRIDNLVIANYFFMGLVILLLMPLIWTPDTEYGDFYYRLLAASGVVDATLTILVTIFHRIYLQHHPEEQSVMFQTQTLYDAQGNAIQTPAKEQKRKMHPLVVVLIVYLMLQILGSLLFRF